MTWCLCCHSRWLFSLAYGSVQKHQNKACIFAQRYMGRGICIAIPEYRYIHHWNAEAD